MLPSQMYSRGLREIKSWISAGFLIHLQAGAMLAIFFLWVCGHLIALLDTWTE